MKKLFSIIVLFSVCASAMAQFSLDIDIIGRVEANPQVYFDGTRSSFNFSNSVLYTKLESSIGEHWNICWVGHWLETGAADRIFDYTPELYRLNNFNDDWEYTGETPNIWRSDWNNFTDFLYLDYNAGGFSIRVGKDVLAVGGFEFDAWDWDCDYDMCSLFWNYQQVYQWGGSVGWMSNDENTELRFQACASPYTMRPWQKGIGSYAFTHRGTYGAIELSNSINFIQNDYEEMSDLSKGLASYTLGLNGTILDNLNIGAEWTNTVYTKTEIKKAADFFSQGSRVILFGKYSPIEQIDIDFRAGYEKMTDEQIDYFEVKEIPDYWYGGATVSYYPLKGKKDLRISATFASNNITKALSMTFGILYDLNFNISK